MRHQTWGGSNGVPVVTDVRLVGRTPITLWEVVLSEPGQLLPPRPCPAAASLGDVTHAVLVLEAPAPVVGA